MDGAGLNDRKNTDIVSRVRFTLHLFIRGRESGRHAYFYILYEKDLSSRFSIVESVKIVVLFR